MGSHKIPESERYKGFANWLQFILARGLVSLLQILPIGLAYKMCQRFPRTHVRKEDNRALPL